MVRAMAPGFMAALGTFVRSGQDRRNLDADRAFIERMLNDGVTNFRYHGIAMDFETFADSHHEEVERQVTNTIGTMLKADSVVDWSRANPDQLNPEFRRRWIWDTSNVSDETLQDLWARLLAGELESPGSVSNDTMSIASDMTKERAEEFQILCSAALCYPDGKPMIIVSCGNPGNDSLRPYGLPYEVLARLVHHRLIVSNMDTRRTLTAREGQLEVAAQQQDLFLILHPSTDGERGNQTGHISGLLFTPAGEELFAVVEKTPVPEYRAAMLTSLKQQGWSVSQVSGKVLNEL